ncbi:MAG: response regulator, partial [Planctomycetes bacterium]|nr:response regulator [Planctomycetota bacterium]
MKSISVLFVDDEEDIRYGFVDRFEDQFTLFTAANGVKALDVLKQNQSIHVVVTDIKMPVMSGLELVKAAKGVVPDVGFIVVSGHAVRYHGVNQPRFGTFPRRTGEVQQWLPQGSSRVVLPNARLVEVNKLLHFLVEIHVDLGRDDVVESSLPAVFQLCPAPVGHVDAHGWVRCSPRAVVHMECGLPFLGKQPVGQQSRSIGVWGTVHDVDRSIARAYVNPAAFLPSGELVLEVTERRSQLTQGIRVLVGTHTQEEAYVEGAESKLIEDDFGIGKKGGFHLRVETLKPFPPDFRVDEEVRRPAADRSG